MNGWIAIVNRCSGSARNPHITRYLGQLQEYRVRIRYTEGRGHASALTREASEAPVVVAVGGDGTIGEIIRGLDRNRQVLAILPAGRGNSLARDLGLYPYGATDLAVLCAKRIDLMQVTYTTATGTRIETLSASNVAVGYAATVADLADKHFRAAGSWCYTAAAAVTSTIKHRFSIQLDDKPSVSAQLSGLMVSSTSHAANFKVFPGADYADGTLELVQLDAGRIGQAIHNLSLLTGLPMYLPPIQKGLQFIQVETREPQLLLIDGELIPDVLSVGIRALPSALSCLVPRDSQ